MVWVLKILTPRPTHDKAAHIADIVAGRVQSRYLRAYDIEANDGRGYIAFTDNPREAMRFDEPAHALACWQMQSKARPLRRDGEPNRPLTAYTAEVVELR